MTEKQSDTKETPIEELQCPKKYVYDTGIIFECKNNCKSEIIGEDVVDLLNELATKCSQLKKENEQLKKENSVFEGKDAKHYQRWVNQIKKYVEEDNPDFTYDDDFIIKIALSYTLQSVRNGESLKRFQWDYKELNKND